jgi:hypothetical protein
LGGRQLEVLKVKHMTKVRWMLCPMMLQGEVTGIIGDSEGVDLAYLDYQAGWGWPEMRENV